MAGNIQGGLKAKKTNMERHGASFYKDIGAKGGRASRTGGFASQVVGKDGMTGKERDMKVGSIGGKISRRTSNKEIK